MTLSLFQLVDQSCEYAAVIAFPASPADSVIVGETVEVNGGQLMV